MACSCVVPVQLETIVLLVHGIALWGFFSQSTVVKNIKRKESKRNDFYIMHDSKKCTGLIHPLRKWLFLAVGTPSANSLKMLAHFGCGHLYSIHTDVKTCMVLWLLDSVPVLCWSVSLPLNKETFIILHSELVWDYFIVIINIWHPMWGKNPQPWD